MGRLRTGTVVWRKVRREGSTVKVPFARITLHRHPLSDGKTRRVEREIRRTDGKPVTDAFARELARAWQSRYDEGHWSPDQDDKDATPSSPSGDTVSAWVSAWLKLQVERRAYSEAEKDQARVIFWLSRVDFGRLVLSEVKPRDAAHFVEQLRSARSPKTDAFLAPRTVRNIVNPVARALRAAVFEEKLTSDPFAVLPTEHRPKAVDAHPEQRRTYRLSRGAVETLLGDDGTEDRWLVLWHLLFLTGARVSEAIALRWCDREERAPLRALVFAQQVHHRTRKRVPVKTRDVREVSEHPLLAAVLDWWHAAGWAQDYGRSPSSHDLIVPARGRPGRPWGSADGPGGPLWQQGVWDALQRDLEGSGLAPHRVHDARHTLISLCSDAGVAATVAERWTHTPTGRSARHLYDAPSWARQCEEMAKIVVRPRNLTRWRAWARRPIPGDS